MDSPIWDQIYKDYKSGGPAWATIEAGLEPHFKKFIEKAIFSKKSAFDIGYGTGQYLKYLKLKDFEIAGIDSSETAHDIAVDTLGEDAALIVGNMYNHNLASSTYDLILSISTLHHGTKDQVKKLLDRVYDRLLDGGYAYITLPIFDSSNEWMTFKDKKEIEPGTYEPLTGPEKGLPHSFYATNEVQELFSKYKNLEIDEVHGRHHIIAQK